MRVWEPFLTELDKQHLAATWQKQHPFGFGQRPALLIVDDYYGALGDRPEPLLQAVRSWPMSCGEAGWRAIDRTAELLAVARRAGIPIIYTTNIADFPSPWALAARPSQLTPEQRARQYEIVAAIAPQPGELVIHKAAPSGFFGTALAPHLIAQGVDTVLVCGETTSGCVRASVVDGCSYRFRMGVVEECTFDRTEAAHAINLFDMDQKYADVVSLADAVAYLERAAALAPTAARR